MIPGRISCEPLGYRSFRKVCPGPGHHIYIISLFNGPTVTSPVEPVKLSIFHDIQMVKLRKYESSSQTIDLLAPLNLNGVI